MSHLRNLFNPSPGGQKPQRFEHLSRAGSSTSSASTAGVAEASAPTAAATVALPEFAVEQAQLRPENRLVFQFDPRSPAADRFRFLRMRLREHWSAGKLKTLLITSPLANDGKSTMLLNLATALAERGKRSVLVIEADLHHSTIAADLRLRTWPGLTDCLLDPSVSPLANVRRVEPMGWYLLPAGEPRRNPTELLQGPASGKVLQKLAESFDWVLIDSPPVVPLSDAIALQQFADATLLIVRAGKTPREAIEQATALLGPKKLVGIVLNAVERRNQQYYQGRYYNDAAHSLED